jgi:hypothetical protein
VESLVQLAARDREFIQPLIIMLKEQLVFYQVRVRVRVCFCVYYSSNTRGLIQHHSSLCLSLSFVLSLSLSLSLAHPPKQAADLIKDALPQIVAQHDGAGNRQGFGSQF